ncbi:hypothetical protein [Mesobacillus subterraneus]|uniref:DUF1436 family protein n=1 Tax=Mesobacillus subterraneus TaxID=285983 RepID=A0A3R9KWN2_9BACI|nr:hypothetical protein [Mesobacillus subterraneus]RSD27794.1 hypothetical protein EJA10_08440 [Mesobacillus subterraneus]
MRDNYGFVSIFIDSFSNLYIIPNSPSKKYEGSLSQVEKVFKLAVPYTDEELEQKVNEALDLFGVIEADDEGKESVIEKVMGIKGYSKATKTLKYISIYWDFEKGYVVEPYQKEKRGYTVLEERTIDVVRDYKPGQLAESIQQALGFASI